MRTSRRRRRTSRRPVRRNVKYYTAPWYKSAPAAAKHRRPSWLGGLRSGWAKGEGPQQRIYKFLNGHGASVIPYRAQIGWEQQGWELLPFTFRRDAAGEQDQETMELLTGSRIVPFIGTSAQVNKALDYLERMPAVWIYPHDTTRGVSEDEHRWIRTATKAELEAYVKAVPGLSKNAKRPKMSELGVFQAVGVVRAARTHEQLGLMPPGLVSQLKRVPPGLYRYGYGKKGAALTKFTKAGLRGAMTSTRIAASKSVEPHWLIDTSEPSYPVVIRAITAQGKTVWRVEEYARWFAEERVPVLAQRSRRGSR